MGSLFIKTGLSPLYVIEMIIKFCVSLEFFVSLDISFCEFVKLGHLSPYSGGGTVCYELLLAHGIFDKITLSYLVERQSVLSCEGNIHFFLTFLEVVCIGHN